MKKLVIISLISFITGAALAQSSPAAGTNPYPGTGVDQNTSVPQSNGVQPPNAISTRFNSDNPNMHPTWEMNGSNYRATYADGMLGRAVTYDRDGNVVARESELEKGSYPAGISSYYAKNYPEETYEVWSNTDATGNVSYYAYRNGETYWFDNKGNYKKRTKTPQATTPTRSFKSSTGK